jgi:hypothetical protein
VEKYSINAVLFSCFHRTTCSLKNHRTEKVTALECSNVTARLVT